MAPKTRNSAGNTLLDPSTRNKKAKKATISTTTTFNPQAEEEAKVRNNVFQQAKNTDWFNRGDEFEHCIHKLYGFYVSSLGYIAGYDGGKYTLTVKPGMELERAGVIQPKEFDEFQEDCKKYLKENNVSTIITDITNNNNNNNNNGGARRRKSPRSILAPGQNKLDETTEEARKGHLMKNTIEQLKKRGLIKLSVGKKLMYPHSLAGTGYCTLRAIYGLLPEDQQVVGSEGLDHILTMCKPEDREYKFRLMVDVVGLQKLLDTCKQDLSGGETFHVGFHWACILRDGRIIDDSKCYDIEGGPNNYQATKDAIKEIANQLDGNYAFLGKKNE